jgi:methyl-accepting chemotaxis protein
MALPAPEGSMTQLARTKKLIQPRLQLRLIGFFMGVAAIGMLLQFLLLGARMAAALGRLDDGGAELADEVPAMMLEVLAFSAAIVLPIVFALGLLLTFRIAGPAYRLETYLRSVARGEDVGPCRIREKDELQSLCDAVNEATEAVRAHRAGAKPETVRTAA